MARVSTYLNFPRSTEAAFHFYAQAFGTQVHEPVMRFRDIPPHPGQEPVAEADLDLVMHIELPILGGHMLMGTDAPESMGHQLTVGNTVTLNLEPDSRSEADRLFQALSEGGKVDMPLMEMFWGGYFGIVTDRFGLRWMFNCDAVA